jgi:hypothetical protein
MIRSKNYFQPSKSKSKSKIANAQISPVYSFFPLHILNIFKKIINK